MRGAFEPVEHRVHRLRELPDLVVGARLRHAAVHRRARDRRGLGPDGLDRTQRAAREVPRQRADEQDEDRDADEQRVRHVAGRVVHLGERTLRDERDAAGGRVDRLTRLEPAVLRRPAVTEERDHVTVAVLGRHDDEAHPAVGLTDVTELARWRTVLELVRELRELLPVGLADARDEVVVHAADEHERRDRERDREHAGGDDRQTPPYGDASHQTHRVAVLSPTSAVRR